MLGCTLEREALHITPRVGPLLRLAGDAGIGQQDEVGQVCPPAAVHMLLPQTYDYRGNHICSSYVLALEEIMFALLRFPCLMDDVMSSKSIVAVFNAAEKRDFRKSTQSGQYQYRLSASFPLKVLSQWFTESFLQ